MAVVVGAVSAPIAFSLVWLIGAITNLVFYQRFSAQFVSPADNHLGAWVILVPAVGGLIIGLMARYGSEAIRGHGIPEALESILIGRSRMSLKVAVLKPLSSALSIGTGGPFGAEGPIVMTGGAFGSLFAQLFKMSSAERKVLLVAGAAGGMAAIFAAPVSGGALGGGASVVRVATAKFHSSRYFGHRCRRLAGAPTGSGPPLSRGGPCAPGGYELGVVVIVGVVAGLAGGALTLMVYAFEDLFTKLPIHWMWWPAIGGLLVGLGGWISPSAGGRLRCDRRPLARQPGDRRGDGPAGRQGDYLVVFPGLGNFRRGPGALVDDRRALGAIEARWIPVGDTSLWAMISMAAVMGGVMRSPLTAMFFALELTHDLNVMPALLLGCTVAHGVTVFTLRRLSSRRRWRVAVIT